MKLKNKASHTIAGREYNLTKLPIMKSGRIAAKIGKSILPAIASAQGIDLKDAVALTKALSTAIQDIDAELFFDDAMLCVNNGCYVIDYDIAEHHYFEKHFAEHPQDLFGSTRLCVERSKNRHTRSEASHTSGIHE